MSSRLPKLAEIRRAHKRIRGVASKTPVVQSPSLTRLFKKGVALKLECFQPIRVFKIRGAFNKISQVPQNDVAAVSSGNHGIAVAYSSRLLRKRATIILPRTAVQEKVTAIKEFGGHAIKFGLNHSEREEKARQILKTTRGAFIHPFNDPDIIAGNGTCGLEIAEQAEDTDSIIVPVGGGGLVSGIAIAAKSTMPGVKVFGVEPKGAAKMQAALREGKPVTLEAPASIADGLIPSSVGDLTLEACKRYVDKVFSVSDEEIIAATRMLVCEAHIFPEPSAAAAAAVLLDKSRRNELGNNVTLVISGGNISLDFLAKTLG